jgi:hypothetical protein
MRQRTACNQSNTSLFSHLLVFLVSLSCFARLCCFEEKSSQFSLMGQGLTLLHASHEVFMRIILIPVVFNLFIKVTIVVMWTSTPAIHTHLHRGPRFLFILFRQWKHVFCFDA